jgi:hypothetical protein
VHRLNGQDSRAYSEREDEAALFRNLSGSRDRRGPGERFDDSLHDRGRNTVAENSDLIPARAVQHLIVLADAHSSLQFGNLKRPHAGLSPFPRDEGEAVERRERALAGDRGSASRRRRTSPKSRAASIFFLMLRVGAEKSFVAFADRVTEAWKDERKRSLYTDDWFRAAAARMILFRAAEAIVRKASWYAPGTRSQVVAYTMARLAYLATELSEGGRLDFLKVWSAQAADGTDLRHRGTDDGCARKPSQGRTTHRRMGKAAGLPQSRLADGSSCDPRFRDYLVAGADAKAEDCEHREQQRVTDGLTALTDVMALGAQYWESVRAFGRSAKLLSPEDDAALLVAAAMPRKLPTDKQATRLIAVRDRCADEGFEPDRVLQE